MVRGQSNNAGHSRAAFSARDDGILAPKWSPVQSNVAKLAPEWKRVLRPIDNRPMEDAMSRRYSRNIWAMVRQGPGTRFEAQRPIRGERNFMSIRSQTLLAAGAVAGVLAIAPASAQDAVKVGLILPMTGGQASTGKQIDNAVKLYMQQNGDTVAGKKIEIILKDDAAVPDNTKRLAQELIVNDKVNFIAGGGEIVEEVKVPLANPDFAPFLQRMKDSKPDAVFVFVPAGQGGNFMKQYAERGLDKSGIKVIGPGDVMDDDLLNGMGDAALGAVTAHLYSAAHPSAMNKEFVASYKKAFGTRPGFMAVSGYDGIHLIYEALKKTGGKTDGDALPRNDECLLRFAGFP